MKIALVGCMGAGKSTIGPLLAERLGLPLCSTDNIIIERHMKSLAEIHREYGANGFFRIEHELLLEVSKEREQLLSPGGGVILDLSNREILKNEYFVVYLKADANVLFDRIKGELGSRPLLLVDQPAVKLKEILDYREKFYNEVAHYIVETKGKSKAVIVDEIYEYLLEHGLLVRCHP